MRHPIGASAAKNKRTHLKELDRPMTPESVDRLGGAVIREIPDAVVYADREGAIRFWNAGAERIFGFSADEAVGRSLDIIIPERLRERHWVGYRQMMATGRSRYGAGDLLSVPAVTKSGATLSVQFTVAVIRGKDGAIDGIVAVLRDVTETYSEMKRLREIAKRHGAN